MTLKLAAGVTWDFYKAAASNERFGAALLCPVFFLCSLLTRVPRLRETGAPQRTLVAHRWLSFR